ncbi:hypothetical protein [Marinivivus vitaminiproducens]|uniref:hypothetical protein n=1 Tax=Marinivivus vitaminiproducens TaxID=3035935 RepID=UPI0027A25870|nr:hypothetical protein P4R82_25130 [Geminicoccaceae bacterium SCSIO 64248]
MSKPSLIAAALVLSLGGCATTSPALSDRDPTIRALHRVAPEAGLSLVDRLTRIGVEELVRQAF